MHEDLNLQKFFRITLKHGQPNMTCHCHNVAMGYMFFNKSILYQLTSAA